MSQLKCKIWDGNDWKPERTVQTAQGGPVTIAKQPMLATYAPKDGEELLYCVGPAQGSSALQWSSTDDGVTWQEARYLPGSSAGESAGLASFNGALWGVYTNGGGKMCSVTGTVVNGRMNWSDENLIGLNPAGEATPSLGFLESSLVTTFIDAGGSYNSLAYSVYSVENPSWSPQQQFGSSQHTSWNNALALFKVRLVCVYGDFTGDYLLSWTAYDGDGWRAGRPARDQFGKPVSATYRVAAVGYGDELFCVYTAANGTLGWSVMHVPTGSGGAADWDRAYWDSSQTMTTSPQADVPALAVHDGNVYCVYLTA